MSLAGGGAGGPIQWDPMSGGGGARGSMYSKLACPGGWVDSLNAKVQCITGNGHMGPPPLWTE